MEKNSLEQRIFIIAPLGQDAHVMAELLARHGFETQICDSLKQCCGQIKSGAGAFVITEEALALGSSSEFFETLSMQPPWSEIPLIILTSGGEFRSARLLELVMEAAGSVTLLERPIATTTLIHSVEVALNSRLRQYQVRELLEEQRRTEHELRQAHEQLADRAKQLQILVESRTAKLAESNKQLRSEIAEREALRRKLLHSQEEERRRIARELHDQMGQNLTALNFGLKSLLVENVRSSRLRRQVQPLQELATQTARDLHRVAFQLRPAALDDLGLVKAIRSLTQAWSARCRIDVDLEAAQYEPVGISSEIETTVYRIIQEALNNVAKHSGARRVAVVLRRTADQVHAIVEDDGRGFDAGPASPSGNGSGRLGLLGIQERLGLVGGSLVIESAPGCGTTLIVRIPIPSSK